MGETAGSDYKLASHKTLMDFVLAFYVINMNKEDTTCLLANEYLFMNK